jgi:hypothetical protein
LIQKKLGFLTGVKSFLLPYGNSGSALPHLVSVLDLENNVAFPLRER